MDPHSITVPQNIFRPISFRIPQQFSRQIGSNSTNSALNSFENPTETISPNNWKVSKKIKHQVISLIDESSRSVSPNNQQKVGSNRQVFFRNHPKNFPCSDKAAKKKCRRPQTKKTKKRPSQRRKKITRGRKIPITIQIDSSQSQSGQKVTINQPSIRYLPQGEKNSDLLKDHVFNHQKNRSQSQFYQGVFLDETRGFKIGCKTKLRQIQISLIDIEESFELQSNAPRHNSLEQIWQSEANQVGSLRPFRQVHPQFFLPNILQIPNQNDQRPINVPTQSSDLSHQNHPAPNAFISPVSNRNLPTTRVSRLTQDRIWNQTILIDDSSNEEINDQIQNHKLWCLHKNKLYESSQLTQEQLQKCDKCSICYESFILSCQKIQRTQKTEGIIKSQLMQRTQEQMVDQNKQNKTEVIQLFCKHFYHKQCITQWLLGKKPQCPICRKDFRKHQAYRQWDPHYLKRINPPYANHQSIAFDGWQMDSTDIHNIYSVDFDSDSFDLNDISTSQQDDESSNYDGDSNDEDVIEVPRSHVQGRNREVFYQLPGWGEKK